MKYFNVKVNGKTYNLEIEETTPNNFSVHKEPSRPQPAPKKSKPAPKGKSSGGASQDTQAPMPGKILEVCVSVGDVVDAGEVVVVLEAMKMENEITAATSGKVLKINVAKGDTVNAGDSLIVIG